MLAKKKYYIYKRQVLLYLSWKLNMTGQLIVENHIYYFPSQQKAKKSIVYEGILDPKYNKKR